MAYRMHLSRSVLLFLLISTTLLTAQTAHDAAELLHRVYLASGGEGWQGVAQAEIDGAIEVGGLKGHFHQLLDMKAGRDVTEVHAGPLQGKQATRTDSLWSVDASGLVNIQDSQTSRTDAITNSFQNRNGWFHVPEEQLAWIGKRNERGVNYTLIAVTPSGGRKLTLWINDTTQLIERIDQVEANHQLSTNLFSDYRKVNGVLYPFVSRTSNGDTTQDQVLTIEKLHFSPTIEEKLFAIPPSTFTDASFPTNQSEVKIPFLIADGRIEIEVSINGHTPLPFLLDTGAENLLTPQAAAMLGVKGVGNVPMSGVGGNQNAQFAEVSTVGVGALQMRDQPFIVTPLPEMDRGDKAPLAGLLGYELLRRFPATFHYSDQTLTFYRPGSEPAHPANALRFPLLFNGNSPAIELTVDGVAGVFGIDTGDQADITLFAPFYNAHRFPVLQPGLVIEQGGFGGGKNNAMRTRVAEVAAGPLKISTPIVTLSFARQGVFSSDSGAGNLGYQLLRNFIFTLDYEHRAGYFQPSPEFGKPFFYNRSGLSLDRADDGSVIVKSVDKDSPAARAGLQGGDKVLLVNGNDPRPQALGSVEALFRDEAGTHCDVKYARQDKEAHALFTLEERLPVNGVYKPLQADPAK